MATLSIAIVTYLPDIALLSRCLKSLHAASDFAMQTGELSGFSLVLVDNSTNPQTHDKLNELLNGKIANLNILKMRLCMAMQQSAAEGIVLSDVWKAIYSVAPDFEKLAAEIGWPQEHLLAINSYRDSSNRYNFLSLNEVTELFCTDTGGFRLKQVRIPEYELGEQCPTIVLERMNDD